MECLVNLCQFFMRQRAAAATLSPLFGMGWIHNVISTLFLLFFALSSLPSLNDTVRRAPLHLRPYSTENDYFELSLFFSPCGAFLLGLNFSGVSSFLELTRQSHPRRLELSHIWILYKPVQEMQRFL